MRAPCMVMLGVGQSVGLACARKFAEADWSVMVVDCDHKTLERAEKDLGDLCQYLHEDQHTRLGLKNALAGTIEQFDGVDAVVSIPPLPEGRALQDMSKEFMSNLFEKGALSSLLAAKVFSEEMVREAEWENEQTERPRHDKSFVTVLSRAAVSSDPGELAVSTAQGAILATTRALAIELAPHKIRSNAVVSVRPHTETTEPWLKTRTPLGRAARATEIADMVFFLASPQARFITGRGFELDGGRSMLNGIIGEDDQAF